MDHALLFHFGNSQIFPQASTRFKIVLSRKFTKPHDLIFFRLKNSTTNGTSTPSISSLSNCCSTTLTVCHPQMANARRLISTLAHHGRFSSATSSSSDHDDDDDQDYKGGNNNGKIAKITSFRAGVSASLALSCVLGILCCGSIIPFMSPRKAIAGFYSGFWTRSGSSDTDNTTESMPSPMGFTSTMRSFLHVVLYLAYPKETAMPEISPMFSTEDINDLKKEVLYQIKIGNSVDEALKQLRKKRADAVSRQDFQTQYLVEMAIVEILISQGKHKEALNMDCLKDLNPTKRDKYAVIGSDIRRYLYKAIIFTIDDKKAEADFYWKKFFENANWDGPF